MTDTQQEFVMKLTEDEVTEFRQAIVYAYNEVVRRSPNSNRKTEKKESLNRFIEKFDEADRKRTHRPLEEFKGISYNSDLSAIHIDSQRWNISDLRNLGPNVKEITITDYDKEAKNVVFVYHPNEDWPRVYVGVE